MNRVFGNTLCRLKVSIFFFSLLLPFTPMYAVVGIQCPFRTTLLVVGSFSANKKNESMK